ncbi:flagellar hook-length control protein FliK [Paenibacillus sp. UNC499MF]|uniref:flagellar hook-length control protein FliK n=1 Tax=Paenibacillus sp. UNC499MF TaxID=1502751 RepID=UPI0008A02AAB|nr:flagellar hook-length control protein FliK [Paenibacillus sp. UNC499MF]SEF57900.1 hook-length control protein FliK [Paenibacillus sp. UNC499MF]
MEMPVASTTPSAPSAGSTAVKAGTAKTTAAAATSAGSGKGDAGTFQEVMSGQLQKEAVGDNASPVDSILAGLLQVIPFLPVSVQEALSDMEGQTGTEGMADLLLSSIQSSPELFSQLSQSDAMQQWTNNASALLQLLSGTQQTGLQAVQLDNGDASLKLQKTVLDLTAMLKQQPDHPVLQQLSAEFKQLVEAALPSLVNQQAGTAGKTAAKAAEQADLVIPAGAADSDPDAAAPVMTVMKTGSAKASLELLAARTGVWNTVRQAAHETVETAQTSTSPASENEPAANGLTGLQEGMKTALPEQAAKAAAPTISAQNFAQELSQFMVKRMSLKMGNGFSEAKLSLRPQHLGTIDVVLTMQNGQLVAQFTADTALGKELLESQLAHLRQSLHSQGVQVDKMEVGQNTMSSTMFQDSRQQQSSQQFLQQRGGGGNQNNSEEMTEWNEELKILEETRKAALGNSFETSA